MLVGVSLFGEVTGNMRWDFDAKGKPVYDNSFTRGLSNLDQSINQAFSNTTNLLIVAREMRPAVTRTWVGLYRYVEERRGGAGNQGAGIWIEDGIAPGPEALRFLHGIADKWSSITGERNNVTWNLVDRGHHLLDAFRNVSASQTLEAVTLDVPETSCLVDVSSESETMEMAAWLNKIQTDTSFSRFKRIFLSDERGVSDAISRNVTHMRSTPALASSGNGRPERRTPGGIINDPSNLALTALKDERQDGIEDLRREVKALRYHHKQDYMDLRNEVDRAILDTKIAFKPLRMAGIPVLIFCLCVSIGQICSWSGFFTRSGTSPTEGPAFRNSALTSNPGPNPPIRQPPEGPADHKPATAAAEATTSSDGHKQESGDLSSTQVGSPGTVVDNADKIRSMIKLNLEALQKLPPEKQKLTAAEVIEIRKLLQRGIDIGRDAADNSGHISSPNAP